VLTKEKLKAHLHYDPETGLFTWIKPTGDRVRVGYVAGCKRSDNGYVILKFERCYLAHRLAFLYMTGSIPKFVDHINGKRDDNRWCNLRSVSRSQNGQNMALPNTNKSGVIGVFWNKGKNKWTARIKVEQRDFHLGHFVDFDDAVKARRAAEVVHGFHQNHGKRLVRGVMLEYPPEPNSENTKRRRA
jgi:hypothetical protein